MLFFLPMKQKGFWRREGWGATRGALLACKGRRRAPGPWCCPACTASSAPARAAPAQLGALYLLQPTRRPSVCPGTAAGQAERGAGLVGWFGCLDECVCVCSFDNHKKFDIITFKRTPLVLLLYF